MNKIETSPITQMQPNGYHKVLDDWNSPTGITVPQGFLSDGVSWIMKEGRTFPAGVLHDYLVKSKMNPKKARDKFAEQMKINKVDRFRIWYLVSLLKLWDAIPICLQKILRPMVF